MENNHGHERIYIYHECRLRIVQFTCQVQTQIWLRDVNTIFKCYNNNYPPPRHHHNKFVKCLLQQERKSYTGWPKKVSHYQNSSLNRIKNR